MKYAECTMREYRSDEKSLIGKIPVWRTVWSHTLHRKISKECPENNEYTCLKCNLVSFEIPNGFLYYESSWI